MRLFRTLRNYFNRRRVATEMAEEMRLHLELQAERFVAAGMSAEDARYAAQREFGNLSAIQQSAREQRGWRAGEELLVDLRFAVRMLGKHPGYTTAAIATLALGIGFITTLFTMINGVALGQLPFEHSERIVHIDVSATQLDEFAARQQSCEALSLVQPASANLRAGTYVSRYSAAVVSTTFLDVLKARPELGRSFLREDGAAGAPRTALIGHQVWVQEFSSSAAVLGAEVKINGEIHTVIGVMPEGFGFPFNQEVWTVRRADEPITGGMVIGRLRDGMSPRLAAEQFTALAQRVGPAPNGAADFVWNADEKTTAAAKPIIKSVEVVPFAQRGVKDAIRVMLAAILAATFLVLLLACANVANLMMVRTIERRKELAVRAAMGASRPRLIRQMLTETSLIAALGAVAGLGIAAWSSSFVWAYMMKERPLTGGAPFWINFDLNGRVFGFVALIAVLVTLLTGLVPALQASRVDVNGALKDGGGAGLRVSRFSRFLVNLQMAFSVSLVTVAGLFATVLVAFNHKTLPYDPRSILTARVALEERRYDDSRMRAQFFGQLEQRLNAAPGVTAAALTSSESLRLAPTPRIEIEGATYERPDDRPACWMESVSADFLMGLGVGLQSGRGFLASDNADAQPVAIVNAAFVERFGNNRDFVGRRFRLAGDPPSAWITIVGVAPDLGSVKAGQASRGAVIYRPLAQQSDRAMTILVRADGEVRRLAAIIRQNVAALDEELPVARVQTVQDIVEQERIGMNTFGSLFIICGFGALMLASVGIYGVIAFTVKLRTREFGVRMALGADRGAIARMVLRQGIRQIAIGLVVGAVLAVGASILLASMFVGFSRSAYDVWIYAGVLTALASVAGLALGIPARRAARVEPMVALRCE